MNIIQELIEKNNGKYIFHSQTGVIEVDGTKISINTNEVNDIKPQTYPFQITLHLDKIYETELTIFPKDLWNEFLDFILPKRRAFVPKPILKQFWFGGNKNLLKQLASDKHFTDSIINERIYLETIKKPIDRVVLTSEYGIKNISQFEKFIYALKRVEKHVKATHNIKKKVCSK